MFGTFPRRCNRALFPEILLTPAPLAPSRYVRPVSIPCRVWARSCGTMAAVWVRKNQVALPPNLFVIPLRILFQYLVFSGVNRLTASKEVHGHYCHDQQQKPYYKFSHGFRGLCCCAHGLKW